MNKIILLLFAFSIASFGQNKVPFMGVETITACSGTLSDHAGAGNYDNKSNGIITILPSKEGENIWLEFKSFQTEACCDVLKAFSGTNTDNSNQIGSYKGASNLGNIVSRVGQPMTLQFTSDNSTVGAGFEAIIHCSSFNLDTKTITSDFNNLTTSIKITSFENWKIASTIPGWLYFSLTNGNFTESNILVNVYDNFTFNDREAFVTFLGINSTTKRVVYVHQKAAKFDVTDSLGVVAQQSNQLISIISNDNWTIINNHSNEIILSTIEGEKSGIVGVQIAENTTNLSKKYELTVIETNTSVAGKVIIIQEASFAGGNISSNIILKNDTKSISTCSGFITDSGGLDGDYNNNSDGEIRIFPNEIGKYVYIDKVHINTENSLDYLQICNGSVFQKSNIMATYSGNITTTSTLTSSANDGSIAVRFMSNKIFTSKGFIFEIGCSTTPGSNPVNMMYLSENKKEIPSIATTIPVSVLGVDGNFSVSGLPAWILASTSTGFINSVISFNVSANIENITRMAVISLTNGSIVNTFEINQLGIKNKNINLITNQTLLILPTISGVSSLVSSFAITSNVRWQLVAPTWVALSQMYGEASNTTIFLTATPLFDASSKTRLGKIFIITADTILTIDVKQPSILPNASTDLAISKSFISLNNAAQTISIAISATGAWFIIENQKKGFDSGIVLSTNSGFGTQTVSFNFPINSNYATKSGSFSVVSSNKELGIFYNQYSQITSFENAEDSENSEKLFAIYPNPSEGKIAIKSSLFVSKLSILNVFGNILQTFNVQSNYANDLYVDVPSGIYLVRIETKFGYFYKKIIMNK